MESKTMQSLHIFIIRLDISIDWKASFNEFENRV